MRCTQLVGLSPEADKFLEENVRLTERECCPTCQHITGGVMDSRVYDTETGKRAGMFDDGPDLYEYTLKDGTIVQEIVQAAPWSSGPCIHLCLRDEQGKWLYKWPAKDIDHC